MRNMLHENMGLISARSNKSDKMNHFFCADTITEAKTGESTTQSALFPLYLYPDPVNPTLFDAADWPPGPHGRTVAWRKR